MNVPVCVDFLPIKKGLSENLVPSNFDGYWENRVCGEKHNNPLECILRPKRPQGRNQQGHNVLDVDWRGARMYKMVYSYNPHQLVRNIYHKSI